MKKTFICFLVLLLFYGCKKKQEALNVNLEHLEKNPYQTILDFLENESLKYKEKSTALLISGLKTKIDKKSIQFEKYYDSKVIVATIISESNRISNELVGQNRLERYNNVFSRLIFYTNQDTIVNAEVIECHTNLSELSVQKDLPGIINFNPLQYKGEVRYRQINQKFLYTVLYENERKGYLVVKNGSQTNHQEVSNKTETNCIDWYIITTYTYPDGTQTVTEAYIGTTCGDPDGCNPDPYLQQLTSGTCPGSGGSPGSDEDPTDRPQKRLCGSYNWKTTGTPNGAGNTVIKNLWATFSPNNNPSVRITITFSDACITIPSYCSINQATLSTMFNDAFNAAVAVVEAGLSSGTIPPGDWSIKAALDAAIKTALIVECAGSHFVNQGCTPDIPWQLPTFCD